MPAQDWQAGSVRDHRTDPRGSRGLADCAQVESPRLAVSKPKSTRRASNNVALQSAGKPLGCPNRPGPLGVRHAQPAPHEGRAGLQASGKGLVNHDRYEGSRRKLDVVWGQVGENNEKLNSHRHLVSRPVYSTFRRLGGMDADDALACRDLDLPGRRKSRRLATRGRLQAVPVRPGLPAGRDTAKNFPRRVTTKRLPAKPSAVPSSRSAPPQRITP